MNAKKKIRAYKSLKKLAKMNKIPLHFPILGIG